jgi:hypothetical protein
LLSREGTFALCDGLVITHGFFNPQGFESLSAVLGDYLKYFSKISAMSQMSGCWQHPELGISVRLGSDGVRLGGLFRVPLRGPRSV